MPIKLLDDNLINKIAAGEVIERPASVVKELVENAIDAGAAKIAVKVVNAGIEQIEVEDNGKGISKKELPLAFLRHATSKIVGEDDLFNISTMGFRGEALPSIASVSRIDVYTCCQGGEGIFARINGGEITNIDYYPCPQGTKIIVKDIFYNTPVRKKFLKSPVSEGSHIFELMSKYALSRPDITFTYSSDKKTFFKTPGNGNLRDAVVAVYGQEFSRSLIEVSFTGDNYAVNGLISRPEIKRVNRKNQIFFINNRPIRSPMLYRAVDTAYKGILISREHPVVILSISVPLGEVDVNVHPQKSEVRFKDEQLIFKMVYEVLKDCLDNLDYEAKWGMPLEEIQEPVRYEDNTAARIDNQQETEFIQEQKIEFKPSSLIPVIKNYKDSADKAPDQVAKNVSYKTDAPNFTIIGQCLNAYILVEINDALYLVDQHAAHERIIYSALKNTYSNNDAISQRLAFPLDINMAADRIDLLENYLDTFRLLGFEIEIMGYNQALVRAVPPLIRGTEAAVIDDILDMLAEGQNADIMNKAITVMSCKKAVKAGECLSHQEMVKIINELLIVEDYKNCPHGRPTMIKMTHADIDRMFKR